MIDDDDDSYDDEEEDNDDDRYDDDEWSVDIAEYVQQCQQICSWWGFNELRIIVQEIRAVFLMMTSLFLMTIMIMMMMMTNMRRMIPTDKIPIGWGYCVGILSGKSSWHCGYAGK